MLLRRLCGVALAGWMIAAAGSASAIELRVASGAPPAFPVNDPVYTTFIKKVAEESNGSVTASQIGVEVVNVSAMLSALENGTIDMGNLLTIIFPAEFPNMMLLGEVGDVSGSVMMAATNEYMLTCDDCQKEFADKGLLYLAALGSNGPQLLTKRPVRTLADLKGMRLRSFSPATTAWIQAMGGIPLSIPFNEEFQAIQTGVADGTLNTAAGLTGNRLAEVVKYYTRFGIYSAANLATFPIRIETWKKLSPDERRAVVRASLYGAATFAPRANEQAKEGAELLKSKGGEVLDPSQELIDAGKAYNAGMVDRAIEKGKSAYGLPNAEAKVKRYVALIEKWKPLVTPIENDSKAVAEMIWDRVWSKVDFDKFGVE